MSFFLPVASYPPHIDNGRGAIRWAGAVPQQIRLHVIRRRQCEVARHVHTRTLAEGTIHHIRQLHTQLADLQQTIACVMFICNSSMESQSLGFTAYLHHSLVTYSKLCTVGRCQLQGFLVCAPVHHSYTTVLPSSPRQPRPHSQPSVVPSDRQVVSPVPCPSMHVVASAPTTIFLFTVFSLLEGPLGPRTFPTHLCHNQLGLLGIASSQGRKRDKWFAHCECHILFALSPAYRIVLPPTESRVPASMTGVPARESVTTRIADCYKQIKKM